MGKCTVVILVLAALAIFPAKILYDLLKDQEPPQLPANRFWGPKIKEGENEDTSIRSFVINITQDVLSDLKNRLILETSTEGNRFIPPLEGVGFEYGFNSEFLNNVSNYWLNKYDWKVREKALNKFPHFKTTISGIEIHFQHVKKSEIKTMTTRPLLLLHGWPSSFAEFQNIIPLLTSPENSEVSFELIMPSLPGFGFSERAHKRGLGPAEMAQIFVTLMKRLGYDQFYIHSQDWGTVLATNMASIYPENVLGFHTTMCHSLNYRSLLKTAAATVFGSWVVDQEDAMKLDFQVLKRLIEEVGYFYLQATKPDTLGVAISNSPSGLAGYILEKFAIGTNWNLFTLPNGGLVPHISLDDLLDEVMIYWVTNSITSSVRIYSEFLRTQNWKMENVPVRVPAGCLQMPADITNRQNKWMLEDKYPELQFRKANRGGHYPNIEVPDLVAKDIIVFINSVETNRPTNLKQEL